MDWALFCRLNRCHLLDQCVKQSNEMKAIHDEKHNHRSHQLVSIYQEHFQRGYSSRNKVNKSNIALKSVSCEFGYSGISWRHLLLSFQPENNNTFNTHNWCRNPFKLNCSSFSLIRPCKERSVSHLRRCEVMSDFDLKSVQAFQRSRCDPINGTLCSLPII